jgi:hypothetical protein
MLEIEHGQRTTGIVDSLVAVHGPWSPSSVPLDSFTNQYAAMPSLHCGFAIWVAIVWWQFFRDSRWRFAGAAHAVFIFFCVIATGNHFVLDAVAGWSIAIGLLAVTGHIAGRRRRFFPRGWRYGRPCDEHGDSSLMPSTTAVSQ